MVDRYPREARIGDREREAATSILTEHYAAGRIDTEEHAERLDAIWSARTRADLDVVFWDLPRLAPAPPPVPVRRTTPWRFPLAVFLVAGLVLAVALQVPWWAWLIAAVVFLKTRGRGAHHGCRQPSAAVQHRPRW